MTTYFPVRTRDGEKTLGPFEMCAHCGRRSSWTRYGGKVTCRECAHARVNPGPQLVRSEGRDLTDVKGSPGVMGETDDPSLRKQDA